MKKPINLSKSLSYAKKLMLTFGKSRAPIYDKEYTFSIHVAGVSFRNRTIEAKKTKENIIQRIKHEISKVDENKVSDLFYEKLVVKLSLFLPKTYLKRVDIDNVAKTVLDCMNKVVYKDDRQVYFLEVIKSKAKKGAIGVTVGRYKAIRIRY